MSKTNKFLWLPLVILLALVVIAGTKIYLDRKSALEYAVSTFTDYRLAINGPFLFDLRDDELVINLSNIVLRNKHDEAALLTAKLLGLKAKVDGLSIASMKVRELIINGAVATITHIEDGTTNWPMSSTDEASESTDWNSLLKKVSVKNTQISLTGFSEKSLQLDLKKLVLSDADDQRQLVLDAKLNQHPLTFTARVENVSGLLLRQEPVTLSAAGSIDNLNIKANGTAGDSSDQTDLRVSIEGKDLSNLTSLISTEIPKLGQLSASARVLGKQGDYQLKNLQLSLDSPTFKLNANGDASHTDDGFGLELELALSSDDISQISSREELAQWQGLKVNLDTKFSYKTGRGQLTELSFKAGDKKQHMDLSAKALQIEHEEMVVTAIQAEQSDLDYQIFDERPNSQPWVYQVHADAFNVSIQKNRDLKIQTHGIYKTLPVSIEGLWQNNGDYHFDVELDKAKATVTGFLRDSVFKISGKLSTPTLKPLAILVNEDEVPIDQGDLDIGFLVKGDDVELSRLDLKLRNGNSNIHVKGGIRNLSELQGLKFDINLHARQLNEINQCVSGSSVAADRTLAALAETDSFATRGDMTFLKSRAIDSAWLNPLMQLLSLQSWIDEYPMLNGKTDVALSLSGAGDTIQVNLTKLDLQSGLASIQWTGIINDRPDDCN